MIDALLAIVLVVGAATLAVAIGALRSSRRSEELGEGRYELLRDQHDRLELLREERQMLVDELKRESHERQQFTELLGEVSPQLVEGLKQAREGSVENARRTELEERLQLLELELERERQGHLQAQQRAEGLEQEHEQLAKVLQEAERLGQEHQRLTEEL